MCALSSRRQFDDYCALRRKRRRSEGPSLGAATAAPQALPLRRTATQLFRLLAGHRVGIAVALVVLMLSTAMTLFPAAATKISVDYVLAGKPLPATWPQRVQNLDRRHLLYWLAGIIAAVSLTEVGIRVACRWYLFMAAARAQTVLTRRVLDHALRLPLHRVQQLKSGGATSIFREDTGSFADFVMDLLYEPWRAIVRLVGSLAVLCYIDWRLFLGMLSLTPLVYFNHRSWIVRIRPLFHSIAAQREQIDARVTETFSGLRVVRAFARVRTEVARLIRQHHLLARLQLHAWAARTRSTVWEVVTVLASLAILTYGGSRVLEGDFSIGDLIMFLSLLGLLLQPLEQLANSAAAVQRGWAGLERVLALLDEPSESATNVVTGFDRCLKVDGRIRLDGVSFRYPGARDLTLRDVTLDINAGETVAIVGASGAGKTTLCNLVARFYDPTEGHIEFDGRDLRDLNPESYRSLLGIVEQDVFLFDGTIRENIVYASPRASRQEVERAARAVQLHNFIRQLPLGYEARVGERGVQLSGGQRQRLAIARALLADRRILIFDEPTSNLDGIAEQAIQESLEQLRRGRTCLLIAHRLSTVRRADRIVVLEAGRIVEIGSHEELIARGGCYFRLFQTQAGGPPTLLLRAA